MQFSSYEGLKLQEKIFRFVKKYKKNKSFLFIY